MGRNMPRFMQAGRCRRRGLTLVEILVVVVVIGVLMGLILPTVSRARSSARATKCASNLRQIGGAWMLYCAEYQGNTLTYGSYYNASYGVAWAEMLAPYLPKENSAFRLCPDTEELRPRTGNYPGTNSRAYISDWSATRPFAGSYSMNLALVADQGGTSTYPTLSSIPEFGLVPLFCDGVWREHPADNTCTVPVDFENGGWTSPFKGIQRVCINRHDRAINVVFCDNHVERVRLPRLWQLQWGKTTTPRDVRSQFPPEYR